MARNIYQKYSQGHFCEPQVKKQECWVGGGGGGRSCSTRMLTLNSPAIIDQGGKALKAERESRGGKGKYLNGRNYRRVRGLRIEISPRHCAPHSG